jgi:hypothetical protein
MRTLHGAEDSEEVLVIPAELFYAPPPPEDSGSIETHRWSREERASEDDFASDSLIQRLLALAGSSVQPAQPALGAAEALLFPDDDASDAAASGSAAMPELSLGGHVDDDEPVEIIRIEAETARPVGTSDEVAPMPAIAAIAADADVAPALAPPMVVIEQVASTPRKRPLLLPGGGARRLSRTRRVKRRRA